MPQHGQGGRPAKKTEEYKDEILDLVYTQQWTQPDIVAWLADNKDLHLDVRTLRRRLKEWGSRQFVRTEDTARLRDRVRFLFRRHGLSDEGMLARLRGEGFTLTPTGLVRIRKELGLVRVETGSRKLEGPWMGADEES